MACFASDLILGGLALLVGAVGIRYPGKVAKVGEVIDAVGSQRSGEAVEPTAWNVRYSLTVSVVIASPAG
jgi:hypothetical protein